MDAAELAGLLPDQTPRSTAMCAPSAAMTQRPRILQETLVKALEKADTLQSSDRLRSWLFRIAHNTTIDFYRRRREEPSDDLAPRSSSGGARTTTPWMRRSWWPR